jgi:hypothetical protein
LPAELLYIAPFLPLPFVLYLPLRTSSRQRYSLRRKLAHELRSIACEPVPSREDKRFNQWDPERIFPPDWSGTLLKLPVILWRGF